MADLPHVAPASWPYEPPPMDARDPRALHALRRPWKDPEAWKGARTAVLGVPFDGAVTGRKGCREGPRGIREALRFCTSFHAPSGVDLRDCGVVDAGDLEVSDDVDETHRRLTAAVEAIAARGAAPVVLGGDNSLSFATVRGLAASLRKEHGKKARLGLIVVDAHHDLREPPPVTSGTPYYRILKELDLVRPTNVVEVGLRPFLNSRHYTELTRKLGVKVLTTADVREMGREAAAEEAMERASDGVHALFLSVDMDGIDQAHAPGVSAPSPYGLHPEEAFAIARAAGSSRLFVGADIVETAPPLDPTGNTARVAAHTLLRLCLRRT